MIVRSSSRLVRWLGVLLLFTRPTVMSAQTAAPSWEPVTEGRLLDPQPGDWMSYRRTYDVTGFSPLAQIDRTNVGDLRLVWAYSVMDDTRWVPTPVVANGLMYVSEGGGRVLAFDVESGDVAWIHERNYPEDIRLSQGYMRSRGVSLYGDKVFWGTADAHLVALDALTGEEIWSVPTGDYRTGEGHSHPPLIAEGKVLLGHAGGDVGAAGIFRAFDAETGELLWKFHTVPREGEPGYEDWAGGAAPPLGGAPWNTISYDPELRLVYFGTGQPYPWASTLRGPGDALYTNTILALDVDTGEKRWHFQLVPGDTYDRAAFESMLVDLVIDGELRKALISTSKIGWGVVLDRQTGAFIHAFRTGFDNVITGWTAAGRPEFDPAMIPDVEDMDTGVAFPVCPHYHGGRDLNSPSYSSATGLYYLGINNACMDVTFSDLDYAPGSRSYRGFSIRTSAVPGYDHVGEFVAFDPVTGERVWMYRTESGAAMTAAALATGGGLVFGGTADRELFALNSETGERLWRTRLNGDVSGAPVTFEVDGKQYLAVGAGGRIAQATSYAPLTETDLPAGGVVWVFALPE
ncbi:MAG: PQQ-binding-like beta-propeller repeat protein [Gemmatimonas sp.]|nr:PQQ-binding-like beta-propeller repeat protein [Gemmatimonas sp.]